MLNFLLFPQHEIFNVFKYFKNAATHLQTFFFCTTDDVSLALKLQLFFFIFESIYYDAIEQMTGSNIEMVSIKMNIFILISTNGRQSTYCYNYTLPLCVCTFFVWKLSHRRTMTRERAMVQCAKQKKKTNEII